MIRRLRTFILVTGTTLSVLIAAAFVASAWWWVWVEIRGGPFIGVHAGAIEYSQSANMSRAVGYLRHGDGLRFALVGKPDRGTWPLIYPFAGVAIPTLLVWRFGRKPVEPGHCRCGYDLTGNTSGVCPECGQPFEPKGDPP